MFETVYLFLMFGVSDRANHTDRLYEFDSRHDA